VGAPGVERWLRVGAALLGGVVFVAGGVGLFVLDTTAGSLFLVGVGLVVVLVALLGRRAQLESLEVLGARIRVRDVVDERLGGAALAAADSGSGVAGARPREQARAVQQLAACYGLYRHVRATQPPSQGRVAALDEVAARMRRIGSEVEFDPVEVSTWFHRGDDALRVIALNLMLACPSSRELLAVLEAVERPRSLFEQYYGLQVGRAMLPDLDAWEEALLAGAIGRARRRRRLRRDADLMALSGAILRDTGAPA
jgi:hypothetical protein